MTDPATLAGPGRSGERFVYDCALRWSDMDAYGHVNNARFLTLYEEARVALFFVAARATGVSFERGIVIARHEIDYLRPVGYGLGSAEATLPPRVRIEMWVSQIRSGSFTVSYELFDDGLVASRAKSVCVPFDMAALRPRRISDGERAFLAPYLHPSEPE